MIRILAVFVFTFAAFFGVRSHAKMMSLSGVKMQPASTWLQGEADIAKILLLKNISPAYSVRGTVVASPQTEGPNYFRHWVRDAALTMDVVFQLAEKEKALTNLSVPKSYYDQLLKDYAQLARREQESAYIGEPIFEVDGNVFLGPWGRPQNDGPALRATVLIKWANELLDQGNLDYVLEKLYAANLPAMTVIKTDLEYVAWHWSDSTFDLWEEVKAQHFYTKMVQRKSLLLGAKLARRLNDPGAAQWYELQARAIENSIVQHAKDQDWVGASLNYSEGLSSKISNLDIAVILGVLHGSYDQFFSPEELSVQNTFYKLVEAFAAIYPVNHKTSSMASALGRYPEDLYAGTNFDGGNPWVLSTLAGAEYCYRLASAAAATNLKIAQNWMQSGDAFIQRVQYHANPDGTLSEQIDRNSGSMTSASNLTWNYSAVLTTFWARQQSEKIIQTFTKRKK